jgi:serine/threonine-protein kinase
MEVKISRGLLLVEAFGLLEGLAELPEEERQRVLEERCARRPELRAAVEELEATPVEGEVELPLRGMTEELLPVLAEAVGAEHWLGECLGPYRIEALLGEGGMGRVYRAVHTGHGGLAAVKLMRPRIGGDGDERVARLRREAHLLARCRHAGIVQIHHTETTPGGETYFAMELVEGMPVTEYCAAQRLGLQARLELWGKVCEAVGAAHEIGVIHRDLKPTNVLAGEGGVKLLDFGVAEAFGDGDLSCRGYMSGPYSAPEQLEETTKRTDVYSLGVLLGELLVGRLPFVWEGRAVRRVRLGELAESGLAWKEAGWLLRAELEAVFAKATAEAPEERYASVGEMEEEVSRVRAGRPVRALRARWPRWEATYVGWRMLRRHAVAAGIASVVLGLGTAALGSYTHGLRTERDAAERARHDADQERRQQELLASLFVNGDGELNAEMTRSLLERAIRKARVVALDPEQRAGVLKGFGADFANIAAYERAEELFRESLAVTEAGGGSGGDEAADTKLRLANAMDLDGDSEAALRLADGVRGGLVRRLSPEDPRVLRADVEMAEAMSSLGRYKEAKPLLEHAVARERGVPQLSADLSNALNDLSIADNYLGDLEGSIALQQESMALDIAAEGARHPDIGQHWLTIANGYGLLREPEKSVAAAREALSILSGSLEPGSHDIVAAESQLARGLMLERQYGEAEGLFRRTIAELGSEKHLTQAEVTARLGLGDVLRQEKRMKDSLNAYEEAFGLARRLFPTPTVFWASCEFGIGTDELLLGRPEEAESVVREALRQDLKLVGPVALRTLQTRILLGRVLVAERRYGEAQAEVVEVRRRAVGASTAMKQVLEDADELTQEIGTGVKT